MNTMEKSLAASPPGARVAGWTQSGVRRAAVIAAAACVLVGGSGAASAQDWHRRWNEHDFPRYAAHIDRWHSGYWYHGPHGGRPGWWWVVGGTWYFYPAPVYPYPDPYAVPPPAVYAAPPAVVVPAPTGTVVATPNSAPYVGPNGQTCREYQSTATVGGAQQQTYGTACLQPDGSWRIVG